MVAIIALRRKYIFNLDAIHWCFGWHRWQSTPSRQDISSPRLVHKACLRHLMPALQELLAHSQIRVDGDVRSAAVGGKRFKVRRGGGGGGTGDDLIVLCPQAISSMAPKARSPARLPHFRSGYWWCRPARLWWSVCNDHLCRQRRRERPLPWCNRRTCPQPCLWARERAPT